MSGAAEDAPSTDLALYRAEAAPSLAATIPFWQRLGVRLTLLMMTLVLLLAVATAVLVIRGFEETQRNALALTRDQLGAQARAQLLAMTRRDAAVISETLHRAELLSRTAAVVVAAAGEGGLEPLLGSDPGSYLAGSTLVFIDAQGFVRAHHGAPGAAQLTLPSARLLTEAAPDSNPERRSVWTLPNQVPARHALIVSTPVYNGDRFGGVLSVAVPLSALDAALADLAPSAASGVLLLDNHGDVVAATGGNNALTRLLGTRGPALLGEINRSERLQTFSADGTRIATGADGTGETDGVDRTDGVDEADTVTLLASAALPRLGWTLAVAAPLSDLAAPPVPIAQGVRREANDTISATLVNIIATFLLTLIGATLFSRSFLAEPIGALVAGAHDLAAGRLGVRIPVTTDSELGVLANTFNQMSQRLKARSDELLAAHEALQQSESRLELAVRGANDGLWEWDIRADSLYLSPRWLQILGYCPGELDPNMATLDDLTHPDDRAARQAQLNAHLSGAAPTYQSEHRLRHRAGGYRWVLARGASLRDDRGEVVRMAGSLTDITDRVDAMTLLERRVAERTSELSALLELSNRMAMTLELTPLVELILETLKTVVDYDAAALWQRRGAVLTLLHDSDPSTPAFHGSADAPVWPLADAPHLQDVMRQRRPISIDNVRDDSPAAHSFRDAYGRAFGTLPDYLATWMGVPLIVRDRVIGMLSFEHRDVGYYTPARARLALAFANEVAIAIESARLYEAAQDKAALEERQHLARELHDSVSQALYGIVLGAHTARAQLDTLGDDTLANTNAVAAPLDYVTNLAQAGIAEMRALIFELRPESLEQEGLTAALRKQAEALRYRHSLGLELTLGDEPDLPLATKQTLYRIAQEALHNIVKHARARQVSIELRHSPDQTRLVIGDDGVGFDPNGDFPGHLGLVSMRERAEAIGADLQLQSSPGHGTRLSVTLVGVRQAVA
ncbi:MAG: PAS domain-containing protein [Trueperaceae bacterium]|nr:PAS domain-containing protein [Trueperaceae bacterium]